MNNERNYLKQIYGERILVVLSKSRDGLTKSDIEKRVNIPIDLLIGTIDMLIKKKKIIETRAIRYKVRDTNEQRSIRSIKKTS